LDEQVENEIDELDEENLKQLEIQTKAIQTGEQFFSLLSFVLQQCSESNPKQLFTKSEVTSILFDELYSAIGQSGSGPYAISIEDIHLAEFTSDGKLSSWSGFASLISAEGIFHLIRSLDGAYGLEGKNAFLSWQKLFNNYEAGLQIRSEGPDVWFGTKDKILIRYSYCDYSNNIAQWDYFEDFIKKDLLKNYEELSKFYCWQRACK